jgi:DNA processing protein
MLPGEESCAWVSLTRAPALGVSALSMTLEILGSAAPSSRPRHVRRAVGMPAAAREFLAARSRTHRERRTGWRILATPLFHSPSALSALLRSASGIVNDDVVGNVDILNDPQLAIVGSRNPSAQGRDTAHDFSEHLADRGLAIVSGLAWGIDSAAHRGALAAQGVTIAVLGSGADIIYPRSNIALAAEIRRHGALSQRISAENSPRRENFPQRNVLIAALSLGTLVVEAARRSAPDHGAAGGGRAGVFAIPVRSKVP